MTGLKRIFLLFCQVAMFKTPPQEIPASQFVLVISVAFALFVGVVKYALIGSEYYSLLRIVLELLVPAALVYLLLLIFKLPERFNQTFAAICGGGAVIYMFALPILPSFFQATESSQHQLSVYIIIALDLWSVAVIAYILKHAVNVGFPSGISLAVVLVLLTLILIESISPSRQPAGDDQPVSIDTER